jgi:hypothetical protein
MEDPNYTIVGSGRLHRGKLDGLVIFRGTLKTDPMHGCNSVVYDGLGFIGNYLTYLT